MFCPNCKDEFRSGFTRCAACDVDLVHDLSSVESEQPPPRPDAMPMPLRLTEYCGFFSLQEARHARDRLRESRIRSEIIIREPPGADWNEPAREEFWLRIDADRVREAPAILGDDPATAEQDSEQGGDSFLCGECGQRVAAEESFCPGCGARFDEG